MNIFDTRIKRSSVMIAKDRLKLLLISDRVNCTPDIFETLQNELYLTVSKYIELTPDKFHIEISRSEIHIRLSGERN